MKKKIIFSFSLKLQKKIKIDQARSLENKQS
jgi:hypothetical protein